MVDRAILEPERERRRRIALAQPGAKDGVNGKVKFQCPGCRAEGHDAHQDNAVYWPDGTFGCAVATDRAHWDAIAAVLGLRLSADGAGPRAASAEAQRSADAPPGGDADARPPDWPLYDGSEVWDFPPVADLIDSLLPATGIVWWGGLPKRYKSLFALYVSLAIACRRSAVAKKFLVRAFPRILYVSREDGGTRLQERRDDILSAWTERPEPGAILFVIRPHLDLGAAAHLAWLRDTCRKNDITMLWLDTWTALSPAADPVGTKDQGQLAAGVVQLCEDINGLVVVVDHSRKNRPEGQPLSSADIFGPVQKWQRAEHVVMLDVVDAGRRLEVFIEGKDLETRRFFLSVTPRGSGEEKFAYAGSVDELADAQRQVGDRNRQAVRATLDAAAQPVSVGEVVALLTAVGITLKPDTVNKHLAALVDAGAATRAGTGRWTRYRGTAPSSEYAAPTA